MHPILKNKEKKMNFENKNIFYFYKKNNYNFFFEKKKGCFFIPKISSLTVNRTIYK